MIGKSGGGRVVTVIAAIVPLLLGDPDCVFVSMKRGEN